MNIRQFIEEIMDYESDTFSARGSKLTLKEAAGLAERCIEYFFKNRIDGVMLSNFLDEEREG
jgi:hypothetical protein